MEAGREGVQLAHDVCELVTVHLGIALHGRQIGGVAFELFQYFALEVGAGENGEDVEKAVYGGAAVPDGTPTRVMDAGLEQELQTQKRPHAFAKRLFVNNLLQNEALRDRSLSGALLFHSGGGRCKWKKGLRRGSR